MAAYKLTNNKNKFGPGMWYSIHILAFNAKTREQQILYCKTIKTLCSNLPCHTCRDHALKYLEETSPEKAINDDNERSMFKWSCDFHNNVNVTKTPPSPMLNWELLYKEYHENAPKGDDIEQKKEEKIPVRGYNQDLAKMFTKSPLKK